MNVSMYQAAAAMNALQQWQEITSGNLAASSLPGFKKQTVSFGAVKAGSMLGQMARAPKFALPQLKSKVNFDAGQIKHTGVPTDVAIEGAGFFEVQLPSGELALTRDGEFRIDGAGRLVTKGGLPVMGGAGEINIDQSNGPITIAYDGQIKQGNLPLGQLRIVEPADPEGLEPVGGGIYLTRGAGFTTEVANPVVRQGYLESANTSPVEEMADLINAMRLFEANQKLVHMQDERIGRTINALGSNN